MPEIHLRLSADLHARAKEAAARDGVSLNTYAREALAFRVVYEHARRGDRDWQRVADYLTRRMR